MGHRVRLVCDGVVMIVRPRTDEDLGACMELIRACHHVDGYPARLPPDVRTFLDAPDAIAAWIAESSGDIIGHVALHLASTPPVIDLACTSTGLTADKLSVVSRLVVSPSARGRGVGSSLLHVVASASIERGRHALLDVHTALQPAIRLYERSGWVRIGAVSVTFENGLALDEFVYLAPESAHLVL